MKEKIDSHEDDNKGKLDAVTVSRSQETSKKTKKKKAKNKRIVDSELENEEKGRG